MRKKVWCCTECGSPEYSGNLSEYDLDYLACSSCGSVEFMLEGGEEPEPEITKWIPGYDALAMKDLVEQPTIRDQFAMAALTGMLANEVRTNSLDADATYCYAIADAMMEARKK